MYPILQNILALIVTFAVALFWLRINDYFAERGWIESKTSRKIIHIGTGPLFVVCWLLFTEDPYTRYLAALVPLSITIQFALVGLSVIKDEAAVIAMSRTGNPREILRGPLYYGIVFVLVTILFWMDNPIGIIALMMVCGGDGLAEILGRKFGRKTLPWSASKTWVGSAGFFLGSWLLSAVILVIFLSAGYWGMPFSNFVLSITWIALAATLVESISPADLDNLTVPITAVFIGFLLL